MWGSLLAPDPSLDPQSYLGIRLLIPGRQKTDKLVPFLVVLADQEPCFLEVGVKTGNYTLKLWVLNIFPV